VEITSECLVERVTIHASSTAPDHSIKLLPSCTAPGPKSMITVRDLEEELAHTHAENECLLDENTVMCQHMCSQEGN